jgi:hypothetical protein
MAATAARSEISHGPGSAAQVQEAEGETDDHADRGQRPVAESSVDPLGREAGHFTGFSIGHQARSTSARCPTSTTTWTSWQTFTSLCSEAARNRATVRTDRAAVRSPPLVSDNESHAVREDGRQWPLTSRMKAEEPPHGVLALGHRTDIAHLTGSRSRRPCLDVYQSPACDWYQTREDVTLELELGTAPSFGTQT